MQRLAKVFVVFRLNRTKNVSSEDLSEQFRRGYFENNRHRHILDWFDYEFKAALGVNVYDQPFSRAAGFGCFKHAHLNVLLLRTDLSDERKAAILAEFLDLSDLNIIRRNLGDLSRYGSLYQVFKRRVTIPEQYLDIVDQSRYARHFFDEDTLIATRRRFAAMPNRH